MILQNKMYLPFAVGLGLNQREDRTTQEAERLGVQAENGHAYHRGGGEHHRLRQPRAGQARYTRGEQTALPSEHTQPNDPAR